MVGAQLNVLTKLVDKVLYYKEKTAGGGAGGDQNSKIQGGGGVHRVRIIFQEGT